MTETNCLNSSENKHTLTQNRLELSTLQKHINKMVKNSLRLQRESVITYMKSQPQKILLMFREHPLIRLKLGQLQSAGRSLFKPPIDSSNEHSRGDISEFENINLKRPKIVDSQSNMQELRIEVNSKPSCQELSLKKPQQLNTELKCSSQFSDSKLSNISNAHTELSLRMTSTLQ